MSFDLKTFKTRSLTALIFTIVMLIGLLVNLWTFLILMLIIHFGCWQEFINILKNIYANRYYKYLPMGIFYITIPVLMLSDLRMTHIGGTELNDHMLKVIPCGIIFSIWINDTMAYITGSLFGKHPLSKISPKKTWEGTIGGGILCIAVITSIGYFSNLYSFKVWMAISFIAAVFGTLGDLLESKLKRMAGIKDSGSFMPGHGGFLDRFDSLLIATPFVWIFTMIFLKG